MTLEERNHMMIYDPVKKVIPRLAVPTIISMLVTSIYNMADTFFVSQIGTSASGAVGVIFSAMSIIQAISFMIGMGAGNNMSRLLGAGKSKEADHYASTAFFTGFLIGLVIIAISIPNLKTVVMLLGSTETIAPYAMAYARYIFLASPFMICSFIMNNLLRFEGMALWAMVGITTGGILNMVLDPVLIFGLEMGTAGAALATAISQFISFLILLAMCNLRKDTIAIKFSNFKPTLLIYRRILYNGLPSLARQGIASASVIVMNYLAGPYGDAAIAAMSIVSRFMMFMNSAVIGFGQGFQPVCGFSFGAGKYDRVKEAFWYCVKVTTIVLTAFAVVGFLFSGAIIRLFRKDDLDVIRIGTLALRAQLLTMPFNGWITMSNMYPQSIGYGFRATVISISRQGLFLIPALLLLTPAIGLLGIQIAQSIADICTFVFSIVLVRGILREMSELSAS